jgi:DNA-binding transcriptional ArsR family regulator
MAALVFFQIVRAFRARRAIVNYMVNNVQMDAVFIALADTTRRGMIARLSTGPATIGELGRPYSISKPAVTKHVKILERAGLIRRKKDGRIHRCTLEPKPMKQAEDWIERYRKFWEGTLDSLARFVEQVQPEEEQ